MSDMTVEKARRILTPGNGDEGIRYGAIAAQSFIEGHASRDPEVEHLEAAINCLRLLKDEAKAEVESLKKILLISEKFSCPCGETTYLLEQNPNHFVGCISHNPTEVEKLKAEIEGLHRFKEMAENESYQRGQALKAEREASRKLVEAAKTGLLAAKRERTWFVRCLALAATKHPGDEKELAALDKLIEDIESVLKLYATPGHSPEGKTL